MDKKMMVLAIGIIAAVVLVTGTAVYFVFAEDIYNLKGSRPSEKVTIGWIGPLSGPASLLGLDNVKAVQLAVEEYNAAKTSNEPEIKLLIENDQYQSERSLRAFRKLVAVDNADVVILNTYSALFLVEDQVLRDQVIVVNPIDNDAKLAELNENIFTIAKETEQLGAIIADSMTDQGYKKAFILYFDGDKFMPTLANDVKNNFENSGGRVVMQRYTTLTSSFSSPIFTGKAYDADAHVFLGYQELGPAMKHTRDAGITAQFYAVNPGMAETSGGAIEGTRLAYFTDIDGNVEETKSFLARYQAKYKELPAAEWTAMQAYDSTRIVIDAIGKARGEQGQFVDNIRKHMLATNLFTGVSGNISIEPDGTSRGIYWSLYTFTEGKVVKYNDRN